MNYSYLSTLAIFFLCRTVKMETKAVEIKNLILISYIWLGGWLTYPLKCLELYLAEGVFSKCSLLLFSVCLLLSLLSLFTEFLLGARYYLFTHLIFIVMTFSKCSFPFYIWRNWDREFIWHSKQVTEPGHYQMDHDCQHQLHLLWEIYKKENYWAAPKGSRTFIWKDFKIQFIQSKTQALKIQKV